MLLNSLTGGGPCDVENSMASECSGGVRGEGVAAVPQKLQQNIDANLLFSK